MYQSLPHETEVTRSQPNVAIDISSLTFQYVYHCQIHGASRKKASCPLQHPKFMKICSFSFILSFTKLNIFYQKVCLELHSNTDKSLNTDKSNTDKKRFQTLENLSYRYAPAASDTAFLNLPMMYAWPLARHFSFLHPVKKYLTLGQIMNSHLLLMKNKVHCFDLQVIEMPTVFSDLYLMAIACIIVIV